MRRRKSREPKQALGLAAVRRRTRYVSTLDSPPWPRGPGQIVATISLRFHSFAISLNKEAFRVSFQFKILVSYPWISKGPAAFCRFSRWRRLPPITILSPLFFLSQRSRERSDESPIIEYTLDCLHDRQLGEKAR